MNALDPRFQDVVVDHPAVGRPITELATPAPLVDVDVLTSNIRIMADYFRDRPARLRPHVKTHRAPVIARMQIAAGAHGITAAKVSMAEAMVDGGIDDVYVANQVTSKNGIERLCRLAQRAKVTVAVDSPDNVRDLSEAAQAFGVVLDVVVEVEAGMGRCGTQPGPETLNLAVDVSRAKGLRFMGLHAYEGHVVQDPEQSVRKSKTEQMLAITMEERDRILTYGLDVPVITCGGTGTYDISGVYPGVTEHQSGSYVYMDPDYQRKVPAFGLAFSLLCTVISRPDPSKVITDGGLQVLARDYGTPATKGHPELVYRYLSEEHGSFLVRDGEMTPLRIGDVVEVYPGHCCSAANLHDHVYAVQNGIVQAIWKATARGKSQ